MWGKVLAVGLMVLGVMVLAFCNAVMGQAFKEVVSIDRRQRKGDLLIKKIFKAAPKDQDGRTTVIGIYQQLRRSDPVLAAEIEQYPPALKVSYKFLQVLVADARQVLQARAGGGAVGAGAGGRVDLDTVQSSIEILREDQDLLAESVGQITRMLQEQQRAIRLMAKGMQICLDTDGGGESLPLFAGKEFHFFISHAQATGGDQANLLSTNLQGRGCKVWYDMEMADITEQAMIDGVKRSCVVIVLLTPSMMSRPFCHLEMRTARDNEVPLIGVYEADERRGKVDFGAEIESAPDDLKYIITQVEFLAFRRRHFEAETMYREILKRSKIVS